MDVLYWLCAANIIIWLGIGIYLCFLAQNQKKIARQLGELELVSHDR